MHECTINGLAEALISLCEDDIGRKEALDTVRGWVTAGAEWEEDER